MNSKNFILETDEVLENAARVDSAIPETFNFGFEEKPLNQITIQELDNMVKKCFELRAEYEDLKHSASEKHEEYIAMQSKVQGILEATGRLNHNTPGAGTFSLVTKYQVGFPKDEEKAALFRQYLIDKGMISELTMPYQKVTSLFNNTMDELGDGADPSKVLPGIDAPEARITVSMRKGK